MAMTAKQYVNAIGRKIKCGGAKKKDIKQQLLADIQLRMSKGESLESIFARMGTVDEIAGSFNESISDAEQKSYARNRKFGMAASFVAVLALLTGLAYWKMPKWIEIEESKYFDKAQVETAMKGTVELLDAGDYAALQGNAIAEMEAYLKEEEIEKMRKQILEEDWGERGQFGTAYIAELSQGNEHYAVGEIMVAYEKVNVTYRLTFDQDMRLAGLYVR